MCICQHLHKPKENIHTINCAIQDDNARIHVHVHVHTSILPLISALTGANAVGLSVSVQQNNCIVVGDVLVWS